MERVILEILNSRDVHFNQMKKLEKLRLGALGEKMIREKIMSYEHIDAIHDVMFEVDGSYFQIDHLMICGSQLIILDAKYFGHDLHIKQGTWYCEDLEIRNPLLSMNNAVTILMKKLLMKHGIQLQLYGQVVWCNPLSYIYGLDRQLPIIQFNRLDEFLQRFPKNKTSIYTTHDIYELRSLYNPFLKHYPEVMDTFLPGLNCPECFSLNGARTKKKYICECCGSRHELETIVFKNLQYYCLVKGENEVDVYDFHRFINYIVTKRAIEKYFAKWINQGSLSYIKKCNYHLLDSLFAEK